MKQIIAGVILAGMSLCAHAANVEVAGYPSREHGQILMNNLEVLASADKSLGASENTPYFFVSDDTEFTDMLLRDTTPEKYIQEYWKFDSDLVCGIRGEPQVLAALDDGSGTPVDWTRQTMLAADSAEPLRIFIGLDKYELLIVNRLAAATGANIEAVIHGASIHSDGSLLATLKRQGSGLAWIDQRHLNAPGFAPALYLSGNGDGDVPSLESLGLGTFPTRFAFALTREGASTETIALAEQACGKGSDDFLAAEEVRTRLDTLTKLHQAAITSKEIAK